MSFRRRVLTAAIAAAAFAASGALTVPSAVAGGSGIPLLRYVRTVDLAEVQADANELADAAEANSAEENAPDRVAQTGKNLTISASLDDEAAKQEAEEDRPGSGLSSRSSVLARGLPTAEPLAIDDSDEGASAWTGLGNFDQRFASAGRASQLEPSDLGMCAGNGYVLETVNAAVQVYDADSGEALLDGGYANPGRRGTGSHGLLPALEHSGPEAIHMNEFYGESPDFDRQLYADLRYGFTEPADEDDPLAGVFGPTFTDPVCRYDAVEDRWVLVNLVLYWDSVATYFSGQTALLIAVSEDGDPTGRWRIFQLDTTNNGEFGGPDHGCSGGFCLGDYPQIGLDANGIYLTTNEFAFFGPGFNGVQLYALNKADLYAAEDGEDPLRSTYLENLESEAYGYGVPSTYSLQPVDGTPDELVPDTMYFGMQLADGATPVDAISVFRLANTDKLNGCEESEASCLSLDDLSETIVDVGTSYAGTLYAMQRPGPTPYLDSYNLRFWGNYPRMSGPVPIDAGSDGKFYGAWIHDGTLVFTTGTGATGSGAASFNAQSGEWRPVAQQIALAMFAVPVDDEGAVADEASDAAVVGVPGQNLGYPSVAVNADGEGIVGATLYGPSHWPSVAYLPFTLSDGEFSLGDLRIALAGAGPNDGFSGVEPPGRRPRWGDYGSAASDGSTIWIAAGYVAQTCTFSEWLAGDFVGTNGNVAGTCGNTRGSVANWSTGIVRYEP